MATAANLSQYLLIKSQITYYQKESIKWNNLATAMEKKLGEQTKAEEKWESQYDCAEECFNDASKELKLNGTVVLKKGESGEKAISRRSPGCGYDFNFNDRDTFAKQFASKKVPKYNPELLEEYTDLDMEYGTMVATTDTILEALKAEQDATKETVSTEAQDTHIIGGT